MTIGPAVGPGEPGPLGFPSAYCSPRASGAGEWKCCSDDPAAIGGDLPAYEGLGIEGSAPYFAGANNDLGTSGLCVNTSMIPAGAGLQEPAADNCPVPCNPTWDETSIHAVCGAARTCCQTRTLGPKDCVTVDGELRPVTGADIGALDENGEVITDWAPGRHDTHQDPSGAACVGFGDASSPEFADCIRQLSVADQRGFCLALAEDQACPVADDYVPPC